jgi:hypothetical protein
VNKRNPLKEYRQFVVMYITSLKDIQAWVNMADTFIEASKIFEPKLKEFWDVILTNAKEGRYEKGGEIPRQTPANLHGPYFVIISYALENLLKALIIKKRGDEISHQFFKSGKLPSLIKSHDLINLCHSAQIKLSIIEEDVLRRLSRQLLWKSRYPVPVNLPDMLNMIKYSDNHIYLTDLLKPDDNEQINNIISRLKAELISLDKPFPP